MSKRLVKIKRTFFLYQLTILLSALGFFLAVIANGYIHNAKEEILANQRKVTDLIVSYIKKGEDIPEIIDEFNIYFILDAEDGTYIINRKDALEESGLFWETFRSKLTYQMQKQKDGTITYPIKEPKEVFKDIKNLQYRTLSDLGWIVVTEADIPSEWSLIKRITTKKDLSNLLVAIFVGLILLKLITDGYFFRLESQITDVHEYSLGNFNQNVIKSSKKRSRTKEHFSKDSFKANQQQKSPAVEIKPKMNFSQKPLGAVSSHKPVSHQEHPIKDVPAESESKEYVGHPSEPEIKAFEPQRIKKVAEEDSSSFEPKIQKPDQVNIQKIQSPVLKELLAELREHKKKS